jgi:cell division protein ZapA
MSAQAVTVVILDREYAVACTPEEKPGLVAAAAFLDARMREIRNNAKLVGLERIAVMAALNIAHDSLQMRGKLEQSGVDVADELRKLNQKLDQALAAGAPRA